MSDWGFYFVLELELTWLLTWFSLFNCEFTAYLKSMFFVFFYPSSISRSHFFAESFLSPQWMSCSKLLSKWDCGQKEELNSLTNGSSSVKPHCGCFFLFYDHIFILEEAQFYSQPEVNFWRGQIWLGCLWVAKQIFFRCQDLKRDTLLEPTWIQPLDALNRARVTKDRCTVECPTWSPAVLFVLKWLIVIYLVTFFFFYTDKLISTLLSTNWRLKHWKHV